MGGKEMGWRQGAEEIMAEQKAKELTERLVKEEKERKLQRLYAEWKRLQLDKIIAEVRDMLWPKSKIAELKVGSSGKLKKGIDLGFAMRDFNITLYADRVSITRGSRSARVVPSVEIANVQVLHEIIGQCALKQFEHPSYRDLTTP